MRRYAQDWNQYFPILDERAGQSVDSKTNRSLALITGQTDPTSAELEMPAYITDYRLSVPVQRIRLIPRSREGCCVPPLTA